MSDTRSIAEQAARDWERRAHGETFLDAKLHPKAMEWLVEAIEAALERASTTARTGASKGHATSPENTGVPDDTPRRNDTQKGTHHGKQRARK